MEPPDIGCKLSWQLNAGQEPAGARVVDKSRMNLLNLTRSSGPTISAVDINDSFGEVLILIIGKVPGNGQNVPYEGLTS